MKQEEQTHCPVEAVVLATHPYKVIHSSSPLPGWEESGQEQHLKRQKILLMECFWVCII